MKSKKSNRKIRRASASNEGTLDKTVKSSGICLAITLLISITLILICSAIAVSIPDSLSLIEPAGYVSLFVSVILGGFFCAKINPRAPYLTSLLCGTYFVILSMLISLALPHTCASGMNVYARLALHALSLACFPTGALLGIKASKPSKSHKRNKRR